MLGQAGGVGSLTLVNQAAHKGSQQEASESRGKESNGFSWAHGLGLPDVLSHNSNGKGQRLGGTGRIVTLCNVSLQLILSPHKEAGGKG